jgi:D-tyrosyl-tRNA(Tyr) deacylase
MRAVIQRVKRASVAVQDTEMVRLELISRIDLGLVTLLGIAAGDCEAQLSRLIHKIAALRIFADENGKMNRSLMDVQGEHLIVSQFTLLADTTKGNRPSFTRAAAPDQARILYERAFEISRNLGLKTEGGRFQSNMLVSIENDGPVTIVLEE